MRTSICPRVAAKSPNGGLTELLDSLGLGDLADRARRALSGGGAQRLALARAWWSMPSSLPSTSRHPS
jgi:ABC-type sulfate/molybdate transport systems ATPase subunit